MSVAGSSLKIALRDRAMSEANGQATGGRLRAYVAGLGILGPILKDRALEWLI